MQFLLKTLEITLFVAGLAAWTVGAYQQVMLVRAWRRERGYAPGPFLFSNYLSAECRLRRDRYFWAVGTFLVCVALLAAVQFALYPSRV